MREYGKLEPTFWTRGSGKALRGHPDAQVVAVYLFSCGASNLIGVYYLPLPTLAHETGSPFEGASKGLAMVCAEGIAAYDVEAELVWVPGLAKRSLGAELKAGDKRLVAVERELDQVGAHPFARAFFEKYGQAFHLRPRPELEALRSPFPSPFEAPSHAPSKPDQIRSDQSRADARPFEAPSTPAAAASGVEKISVALRSHSEYACLDINAVALAIEGRRIGSGTPVDEVVKAIADCAADSTGLGLKAESIQRKLRGYCDQAHESAKRARARAQLAPVKTEPKPKYIEDSDFAAMFGTGKSDPPPPLPGGRPSVPRREPQRDLIQKTIPTEGVKAS
jgi:hypothetical protein